MVSNILEGDIPTVSPPLFLERIKYPEKGVIFLFKKYIKTRILVTIILLLVAILLVAAIFMHDATPEEREFSGTFVTGEKINGHLYQA